jgi:hypothetical protein
MPNLIGLLANCVFVCLCVSGGGCGGRVGGVGEVWCVGG